MDDSRDPFQCFQTTDVVLRPTGRPRRSCSSVKKNYVDYNEKLHGKDPLFGFLPQCSASIVQPHRKANSAGSIGGVIESTAAVGMLQSRSEQRQSITVPSTGRSRKLTPNHGDALRQPLLTVAINDPRSAKNERPSSDLQLALDTELLSPLQSQSTAQNELMSSRATPEKSVSQHREAVSPQISSESAVLPAADVTTEQPPAERSPAIPCITVTSPQAALGNETTIAENSITLLSVARLNMEERTAPCSDSLVSKLDQMQSPSVTASLDSRQPLQEVQSPGSHMNREDAKKRTRKRNLRNKERKLRKKQHKLQTQSLNAAPNASNINEQQSANSGGDNSNPAHVAACDNDSAAAITRTKRVINPAAINPAEESKVQAKKAKPLHPGCTWQPSWQSRNLL